SAQQRRRECQGTRPDLSRARRGKNGQTNRADQFARNCDEHAGTDSLAPYPLRRHTRMRSLKLLAGVLFTTLIAWYALAPARAALAQSAGPQALPISDSIAAPRDIPYPGAIRIAVDATDIERRIFVVSETVPVRGGEKLTLLYPEWLPGNHS